MNPSNVEEKSPSPSLKKVSFGAIGKKETKTKTEYPIYPDPNGQAATLAARIKSRQEELEALDGALKTDKADLKQLVSPFYFTHNQGKVEVPSSIAVKSEAGEVLVTFQNRYPKLESEAELVPILGERMERCFRQTFTIEIDGDKIPIEQVQELVNELQELFARFQATVALNVKEAIKPVDDFHTLRHSLLTPEQNLALDQVCPIQAMVKVKGRK